MTTTDVRELRSTTMRMIANELASGSDRARLLTDNTAGFIHWLRIWADQLDPAHDADGDAYLVRRLRELAEDEDDGTSSAARILIRRIDHLEQR